MIKKKLLRVDINFSMHRSSGEFVNDKEYPDPDSEIGCSITINNFSSQDLVFDENSFWDYTNFEIVNTTTNEQVGCLSPTPSEFAPVLFKIESDEKHSFPVGYSAYSCFMCTRNNDGKLLYEEPGTYKLWHEDFPNDICTFTVSKDGILSQVMDMKVYNSN